jgi:hypothetical protein
MITSGPMPLMSPQLMPMTGLFIIANMKKEKHSRRNLHALSGVDA